MLNSVSYHKGLLNCVLMLHMFCYACLQVIRQFFATLNAFNQASVGGSADDDNLFAAYDAVQHYMKFICMPKLAGQHTGPVCHASNHGTQVDGPPSRTVLLITQYIFLGLM